MTAAPEEEDVEVEERFFSHPLANVLNFLKLCRIDEAAYRFSYTC